MTYTPQGPFTTGGTSTAGNLTAMDAGIASAVPLDGSASMTGSLKLASGHQETGGVGTTATASGAGQSWGYVQNFFMQMTNVPSSITLASSSASNAGTPSINTITTRSFNFFFANVAAGLTYWVGTYTTVGNCLLAVDAAAQTFEHHCDGCNALNSAQPLASLLVDHTYPEVALTYVCPHCGQSEHFTTTLTDADERDETPQGEGEYATTRGAQATLIRALLGLLGQPVAA
jgi:hypothetical protein